MYCVFSFLKNTYVAHLLLWLCFSNNNGSWRFSKESACKVGDTRDVGLIPGLGSPGEGNGNPLQYSCLENSTDRGAWLGHKELEMTEQLNPQARRFLLIRTKKYATPSCSFLVLFNWEITDIQHYTNSKYTTWWFDILWNDHHSKFNIHYQT